MTSSGRATYHHGDLRAALIAGAQQLLDAQGLENFSLRAVARHAGVSPAAPAYHFGDAASLLTEVALAGFQRLERTMITRAATPGARPLARLHAMGDAYIHFALANPALFHLMFRKEKLHITADLKAAAVAAFAPLQAAVFELAGVQQDRIDAPLLASMLAAWAMVHGFAHLALDGQFERFAGSTPLPAFYDTFIALAISQLKFPAGATP